MVIVEKEAKGAGSSADRYVRSLTTYMATAKPNALAEEYAITLARYMRRDKAAQVDEPKVERVLATGGRAAGAAVTWEDALLELDARMEKRSTRSKKPAHHLVTSVHAGEEPTPAQCDAIVATLADELGCDAGLILWALHGDTDHRHLHILVLSLDVNGAATAYGHQGKSHEAMQRAIARIEHEHGFTCETGARYEIADGKVRRTASLPDITPNKSAKSRAPIGTEVLN